MITFINSLLLCETVTGLNWSSKITNEQVQANADNIFDFDCVFTNTVFN